MMVKLWARFRRWLHLLGHLFALLPSIVLNHALEVHQATDRYDHEMTPNRFGLKTVSRHVWMGCTCGRAFWQQSVTYDCASCHRWPVSGPTDICPSCAKYVGKERDG